MQFPDLIRLSLRTLSSHRMRTILTTLGLIIGIASVVLLTAMGKGIHQFVLKEFTQFGTNLIAIFPGKTTTFGMSGATISTVRPLTQDDAVSLQKLDQVISAVPLVQGNARIEAGHKQRRANVFGVSAGVPEVWQIKVQQGRFLPDDNVNNPRAFAVLGSKLRAELFPNSNPLGQRVRIGADRFRVIGVMESKGQMLGFDLDDSIYIPAAKSLEMFDRNGVMEIDLLYKPSRSSNEVETAVRRLLIARHGREDFTIITQDQMLSSLDDILNVLTFAVAALGGISLLVGSVGIMTIMTIAVSERISEIGLLRAIGAEQKTIFQLFLLEALTLSTIGGCTGILLGGCCVIMLQLLLPELPLQLAWGYILFAFLLSLVIGMISGVFPAIKAAQWQPLEALRTE